MGKVIGMKKVEVFLKPEEFSILEELSQKDGVTQTEYLRQCLMFDAFTKGHKKAVKIVMKRALHMISRKWASYGYDNFYEPGESMQEYDSKD